MFRKKNGKKTHPRIPDQVRLVHQSVLMSPPDIYPPLLFLFQSRINTVGDTFTSVDKLSDTPIWLYYWMRAGNHQTRRVRLSRRRAFFNLRYFNLWFDPGQFIFYFLAGNGSHATRTSSTFNPLARRIHVLHSGGPVQH